MLSTHGAPITGDPLTHQACLARLRDLGATVALEHDVHESFSGDGLIVARFAAAPEVVAFPPIERNRYSTSYWPNPLFELAALAKGAHAPASATSAQQAAATFKTADGPIRSVGVWLELNRDSALGQAGERILAPADTVLLPYLHEHGQWQTDSLDLALAHLDRDAAYAFVDIGANIGMVARQFLEAFPGIRACFCVEPDARNFEALQFNLRKYADRDLRCFPFALGAADGVLPFYRDAGNVGNYSLAPDAMRGRAFETGVVGTVDARVWALETLSGFDRLIVKTDTQGLDETLVCRIPRSIWLKVAFASIEIWRIEKPAFDERLFRNVVLSFPHRSFRGELNGPVDDILDYAHGSDWTFHDLYLWR
jgi:FkbM family methyltransferase